MASREEKLVGAFRAVMNESGYIAAVLDAMNEADLMALRYIAEELAEETNSALSRRALERIRKRRAEHRDHLDSGGPEQQAAHLPSS